MVVKLCTPMIRFAKHFIVHCNKPVKSGFVVKLAHVKIMFLASITTGPTEQPNFHHYTPTVPMSVTPMMPSPVPHSIQNYRSHSLQALK